MGFSRDDDGEAIAEFLLKLEQDRHTTSVIHYMTSGHDRSGRIAKTKSGLIMIRRLSGRLIQTLFPRRDRRLGENSTNLTGDPKGEKLFNSGNSTLTLARTRRLRCTGNTMDLFWKGWHPICV